MEASAVVGIQQVMALYGHLLDDHRWDRLDEVFAADAVADYSSGGTSRRLHGLAEITAFLSTANASSAHHVANVYVYEDGGRTLVSTKFFVPYTRPQHDPHRWYGGEYHDVVVETPAGWRIQERSVTGRWQFTEDSEAAPAHRRTF